MVFPPACSMLITPGINDQPLVQLPSLAGEAYDKIARMLGLELKPHGGAVLEALALQGDPNRYRFGVPMKKHANCDFSYAGLKTSVRLCIERELGEPSTSQQGASECVGYEPNNLVC